MQNLSAQDEKEIRKKILIKYNEKVKQGVFPKEESIPDFETYYKDKKNIETLRFMIDKKNNRQPTSTDYENDAKRIAQRGLTNKNLGGKRKKTAKRRSKTAKKTSKKTMGGKKRRPKKSSKK